MKSTKFLTLFLLSFIISAIHAQIPNWQWVETAYQNQGGSPFVMCNDINGNSFIMGEFTDTLIFGSTTLVNSMGNGDPNTYVAKYDAFGNVQWAKGFLGPVNNPGSLCADRNGNVYVTGSGAAPIIIDNDTFQGSSYLAKFSPGGTLLSITPNPDKYIAIDQNNDMFRTGIFDDSLFYNNTYIGYSAQTSVYVLKMDPNGNLLWGKTAINHSQNSFNPTGIITDSAGNCYINGTFGYGVATGTDTISFDLIDLIDTSTNPVGSLNTFVAKYSAAGTLQFARQSEGNGFSSIAGMSADNAGNLFMAGSYGGGSIGFGPFTISDPNNTGTFNAGYAVRYDSSGHEAWAASVYGAGTGCTGIASDDQGNAYVAGYWSDTLYLGTDTTLYQSLPFTGGLNFIAKYNAAGHVTYVSPIGKASTYFSAMSKDMNNDIFIAGSSGDTGISFGRVMLIQPVGWSGSIAAASVFIAKLATVADGIDPIQTQAAGISVYPDPTDGSVYFKGLSGGYGIAIYDLAGAQVISQNANNDSQALDLSPLAKGMYLYRVSDQNQTVLGQGKIVVR
jgi:hypothetical protein